MALAKIMTAVKVKMDRSEKIGMAKNHSQNCLIAIFVHEIGDFPKNRKINLTINTNILFTV